MVVYDPKRVDYQELLRIFFEEHDPTQGMRQGNDVGTQYRSAIYWTSDSQQRQAEAAAARYGKALKQAGYPPLSTEIAAAGPFYFAEDYHQQYLAKNPRGYCGLRGTGVACEIG
jgi:peptide-methionine (S)-S-oxide reductase